MVREGGQSTGGCRGGDSWGRSLPEAVGVGDTFTVDAARWLQVRLSSLEEEGAVLVDSDYVVWQGEEQRRAARCGAEARNDGAVVRCQNCASPQSKGNAADMGMRHVGWCRKPR
jgi:hypothetical protein